MAKPFVKWAGGKRQHLKEIVPRMPSDFEAYCEPFVGGGALFFEVAEGHRACLNDTNKYLMAAYGRIRENPYAVMSILDGMQIEESRRRDRKAYYYEVRARFNQEKDELLNAGWSREYYLNILAALFIYLNKRCFNGLYRVNKKGEFNVSYNNSTKPLYDRGNIYAVSERLKDAVLLSHDFEPACNFANKGDFVFFDSPYDKLNEGTFTKYSETGFDEADHRRVAHTFRELSERGCYCMAMNHDTPLIRGLYADYNIEVVSATRSICGDGNKRTGATELIIRSY